MNNNNKKYFFQIKKKRSLSDQIQKQKHEFKENIYYSGEK